MMMMEFKCCDKLLKFSSVQGLTVTVSDLVLSRWQLSLVHTWSHSLHIFETTEEVKSRCTTSDHHSNCRDSDLTGSDMQFQILSRQALTSPTESLRAIVCVVLHTYPELAASMMMRALEDDVTTTTPHHWKTLGDNHSTVC